MESLMEAVASLIGIRNDATYESQAAIEMEVLARPFVSSVRSYPFVMEANERERVIRLKDLLAAIIEDIRSGRSVEMIAARFHKTVADLAVDACRRARRSADLNEVVLSGEVWQNQILLDLVRKELKRDGFTVYTHCQVPTNDSGLALGQAVVANYSSGIGELLSPQGYAPITRDDQPSGEKVSRKNIAR
jgi:hydrogenase maturation protein HypF